MHRLGIVLAGCLLAPSLAVADDDRFLLAGVVLGRSIHDAPNRDGTVFGAEVSAGVARDVMTDEMGKGLLGWVGGYVDTLHDLGSDTTRFSIGPEIGVWYFGLDGGIVRELDEPGRYGLTIRPALTVGVISVFARYTRFFEAIPEQAHVELGLMLKYPFAPDLTIP